MPRPRKPTALHRLEGTRPNHRYAGNKRDNEPAPNAPLGDPPACLTPEQMAAWHEVAASLAPGVAFNSDRFALEIVARLLAKLRSPEGLKAAELSILRGGLASFGMTPSDRSRVAPALGEPKKPAVADPWDALQ